MYIFKAILFAVLLITLLYKETVQDLECILNEQTVYADLLNEFLRSIETVNGRNIEDLTITAELYEERMISIMSNVISDTSENRNPHQLCSRTVQLCLTDEEMGNASITAEGIETIEEWGQTEKLDPEIFNVNEIQIFEFILENLPALKCKVQKHTESSNNIDLSDVRTNITPFRGVLLDDLFISTDDVAASDYFYFYIFIFRQESRYPMFIFQSRSLDRYFPQYEIRDVDNNVNENRQPHNIANNSENGHT